VTGTAWPVLRRLEQVDVRRHQPLAQREKNSQPAVSSQSLRQPCLGAMSLKRSVSSAQYVGSSDDTGKTQPLGVGSGDGGGGGGGGGG